MAKYKFDLNQLFIFQPRISRSFCHLYVSNPTPLEENNLGRLFIISEIYSQDPANQEIAETIQEVMKANYYGSSEFDLEIAFTNALQKTNQKLQELISWGKVDWLDKINIIIAVLKDGSLNLTQLGNLQAFLIHREKIVDILSQAGQDSRGQINPLKVFSNVISGSLVDNDQLIFCTTSFLDYISLEKIKRLFLENEPKEAMTNLEALLADCDPKTAFAALTMKLVPTTTKVPSSNISQAPLSYQRNQPQTSMEELISKERNTNQLLTPSIWPKVSELSGGLASQLKKLTKKGKEALGRSQGARPAGGNYPYNLHYQPRTGLTSGPRRNILLIIIFNILITLKKIVLGFWSLLNGLIGLFRKRKGYQSKLPRYSSGSRRGLLARFVLWFQKLSIQRKVLFIAAVILVFFFAQSLVFSGEKQNVNKSKKEIAQIFTTVTDKISSAEAALSYDNEDGAKELLRESEELLKGVPNIKKYQQEIDELNNKIQAQWERTKHITDIASPTVVADFSKENGTISLNGIVMSGGYFYGFNQTNKTIYRYDIKGGKIDNYPNQLTEAANSRDFVLTPTSIIILGANDSLSEFNLADHSFKNLAISFANKDKTLKDFTYYEGKLYFLDPKNNQISRHQKAATGYGQGTSWLKDSSLNIKDGVSLAVDGSVWLLKSTGEILKLVNGQNSDFKLGIVEPQFNNPVKIWTDAAAKNLYVLDPSNKRLVVFSKDGKFIGQYTSGQFTNLQDFVISEKDKKAYLLSDTKVFQIDLK